MEYEEGREDGEIEVDGQGEVPADPSDRKLAYIMLASFGFLTLVFCCGGGLITGLAGNESEDDGVLAAMLLTGPACCSLTGLLAAIPGLFWFHGKKKQQVLLPIAAGVLAAFVGGVAIILFFTVLWPSL